MPLPGPAHLNISGALVRVPFPFGPSEDDAQVPLSATYYDGSVHPRGFLQTQVEEGHRVDSFTSSKPIHEQEINTCCI